MPRLPPRWREATADGEIRSCCPQRAELLKSARSLKECESFSALLGDLYRDVSVPKSAAKWAGAVQLRATEQGTRQPLTRV